jgi:hypothetical protein
MLCTCMAVCGHAAGVGRDRDREHALHAAAGDAQERTGQDPDRRTPVQPRQTTTQKVWQKIVASKVRLMAHQARCQTNRWRPARASYA